MSLSSTQQHQILQILQILLQIHFVVLLPHTTSSDWHTTPWPGLKVCKISSVRKRTKWFFLIPRWAQHGMDMLTKVRDKIPENVFPPCTHYLWTCQKNRDQLSEHIFTHVPTS